MFCTLKLFGFVGSKSGVLHLGVHQIQIRFFLQVGTKINGTTTVTVHLKKD